MVELSVFGGVVLRRDGEPVTGRPAQRHHLAILALLAASPGCSASRDKLIGHLWPETDTATARHRLSVALHVLRRGLGDDCLTVAGDTVALNGSAISSDLGAFHEAVESGKLEEAVRLYAGPFLDGFCLPDARAFDPWMEGERAGLAGRYRAALERLVAEAEKLGDTRAALDAWRRLAVHDRYDSSVAMGLMRAFAAAGEGPSAVRHARAYATLVEADLEMPPDPDVMRLADELAATPREPAGPTQTAGLLGEVGQEASRPPQHEAAREPELRMGTAAQPHPNGRHARPAEPSQSSEPYLHLARRLAGWAAVAVLLTVIAAVLLSVRTTPQSGPGPEAPVSAPSAVDD